MSDMATILVVDDDPIVRDVVVRYLERDGHRTLVAEDGDRADELLREEQLDLVVLDVMLPGQDGLALSRSIRSNSTLPVILLTARGEEADRIVGLELGADDYVTKPFSPRELAARVKSILRRARSASAPLPPASPARSLVVDEERARITYRGTVLVLTRYEYLLLKFLAAHPERVYSRAQLLDQVWGSSQTSLE